ncbi:hypothetical protein ACN9MJ_13635 [Acidovorax facilis]|uniref:hypothetical protein n=1 Tax=Acidovorax facilis TaxID=12917 RepID=UPI003CF32EA9
MQTTAETPAAQADAAKAITSLRKRLARWELDHLRTHCAELAKRLETALERIDALESEASRAWDVAESWREDAMQMVNELQDKGKNIGLTQSGELVAMPEATNTTNHLIDGATAEEHRAAALVMACFGTDSPEALRFSQFIVERNGLPWLADSAQTTTTGVQA